MADTTARALRLLSLLQRRRYWPGAELAARLQVSDRTLRRDVDRLRELGYTVAADRGVAGGYRLGGSTGDTALLLDDDEAIALAVALHSAARGTSDLAEASLGALTKVLSTLGPAQRRRAETVRSAVAVGSPTGDATVRLSVLDAVATACRDHVRLSFDYVAGDGTASTRYVEPCQLVARSDRWYLVAYDTDRADWRTFRVDRMEQPALARNRFVPRPPPATDLSDYVGHRMRELQVAHRVVVEVEVAADQVRDAYGTWVTVFDLGPSRCRIEMDADSFLWPTHLVANLRAPFTVLGPPEFHAHLQSLARHLTDSTGS